MTSLLLWCFQHVVLFYHILLQLDAFTPYKDLLLQQLMVDSAEVTATGMEGGKYNENLDPAALLPLLQGTGQYRLHLVLSRGKRSRLLPKSCGHTQELSPTWFLNRDRHPYRSMSTVCYSRQGFRTSDALDCSETIGSHRFVSGGADGKRFPSRGSA